MSQPARQAGPERGFRDRPSGNAAGTAPRRRGSDSDVREVCVDTTRMGQQALSGWRHKIGEPVARQVSKRTRLTSEQVQAAIGVAFFVSSVIYVAKTVTAVARDR